MTFNIFWEIAPCGQTYSDMLWFIYSLSTGLTFSILMSYVYIV